MADRFDRVLRGAARRGRTVGVCPDAGLLAAYVDGALAPDERRLLERHLADCAMCQEHLSLLGSVSVDATPRAEEPGWLGQWGWMIPVATTVVLVGVWTQLPDNQPLQAPVAEVAQQAATPRKPAREAEPLGDDALESRRADRKASEFAAKSAPSRSRPAAPAPPRSLDTLARRQENDAGTGSRSAAVDQSVQRERAAGALAGQAAPPPAAAAPATPPPAAAVQAAEPLPPPAERVTVTDAAKVAESDLRKSKESAPLVASASPAEMFRAHGAVIELSEDGGRNWRTVFTLPSGTVTAAACAEGACWFGTSEGRIERRAPGGFAGSSLPVKAAVVGITPDGALAAVATVADGRRFRTTDAGRGWAEVR